MKWKCFVLIPMIAVVIGFLSCIHSHAPAYVTRIQDSQFTDAATHAEPLYSCDFQINYYRMNQQIYFEWGKLFQFSIDSGRILLYSPTLQNIDTRAYSYRMEEFDPDDRDDLCHVFEPILLDGWVLEEISIQNGKWVCRAVAPSDDGDIDSSYWFEDTAGEIAFELFMEVFFEILEVLIRSAN